MGTKAPSSQKSKYLGTCALDLANLELLSIIYQKSGLLFSLYSEKPSFQIHKTANPIWQNVYSLILLQCKILIIRHQQTIFGLVKICAISFQ